MLDREATADGVRRVVEDFNARRRGPPPAQGGPPVVTPTRDVDAEVEAWRERRAERRAAAPPRRPPGTRRRAAARPPGPLVATGNGAER